MNAFGHAVAAAWERSDGAFLFGAMLPDLATLVGARVDGAEEAAVADGLRHHVTTDLCFHALPSFLDWWSEAAGGLAAEGLRRHSARAASHVAIELLLDGELAREPAHAQVHEAALSAALERAEPSWRREPSGDWRALLRRLSAAGPPHDLRQPEIVASRVERALARRPRLALREEERSPLRRWVAELASRAGGRPRRLAASLEEALRARQSAPAEGRSRPTQPRSSEPTTRPWSQDQ